MADDWPCYLAVLFAFFLCAFFLALCGVGAVLSIRLKTSSKLLGLSAMPNPLSRVHPTATVILGNAGIRALAERPRLAVLFAEAISSWSNVEFFLQNLFVHLFGGNATLATNIYLSLTTRGPKKAALRQAIEAVPDEKVRKLIRVLIRMSETSQGLRDDLAHHVWGFSPELADALLLADPKHLIDPANLNRDHIFVYLERDFHNIIAANDKLCAHGLTLLNGLRNSNPEIKAQLLQQLYDDNEIREAMKLQS
jgi:hypothetical protein